MDELTAPSLVIAMPELLDPNFHRSVVLLIEQTGEGAFGLVINRPAETRVADLCANLDVSWAGDDRTVAQLGGPVAVQQGFVLHGPVADDVSVNSQEIAPGIHMALDMATFRTLCRRPPTEFRMLLGYSGWGSGQLEQELAAGAWLVTEASKDLVFETPIDAIWEHALRGLGIDPSMLVPGSGVH